MEPKFYNLPDHLARIFDSPEFEAAAKQLGKSIAEFRDAVEHALKAEVAAARAAELKAFETETSERALAFALGKSKKELDAHTVPAAVAALRGHVEVELKKIIGDRRAADLAAYEAKLTKRVLAKTK